MVADAMPAEVRWLEPISPSAAQCQHIRSVSIDRVESVGANIGAAALSELREVLGLILDID